MAKDSSGQSLVEFSLVLPAAFFMILLMFELFFIARTKLVLGFSADRIARAAAAQGEVRFLSRGKNWRNISRSARFGESLSPPEYPPNLSPDGRLTPARRWSSPWIRAGASPWWTFLIKSFRSSGSWI